VERGLRKPSADILQGIAKGLRISAETLYVQAGILEDRPVADVASAIMSDLAITERQKQALVQIYDAFRDETARNVARMTAEEPETNTTSTSRSAKASREKASSTNVPRSTTPRPKAAGKSHDAPRVAARTTKEV
jgi:transcriptional regulator with XRE-family HTH domain